MKKASTIFVTLIALSEAVPSAAFSFIPSQNQQRCFVQKNSSSSLKMGLFDGVKDAFTAPALERSTLDSERETPIDRWMGWNVQSENGGTTASGSKAPINFVDSMDAVNYVTVSLGKPMGIVFEENDEEYGGIFVLSLKEGGFAEQSGMFKPGDQLVAVNSQKVCGMSFDDALGAIVDSETAETELLLFRGTADQFYGPTGASKEWLDEFLSGSSVTDEVAEKS